MAEILLLGSDRSRISRIEALLRLDGHILYVLKDAQRWRDAESARDVDLIVGAMSPSAWLFASGSQDPRGFLTPFLFIQYEQALPIQTQREERLIDWVSVPFDEQELLARIDALVRVGRAVRSMRNETRGASDAVAPRANAESAFTRFATQASAFLGTRIPPYARPHAPYEDVATRVAAWADRRDAFEPGHADRVATFSAQIAKRIGLPESVAVTAVRAARLHDIGKVTLPIAMLRQSGPLTSDQIVLIQTHPNRGAEILRALNVDDSVIDAIHDHHDHVDGNGYYGKMGRELTWAARILAVAEVFDAMTSSLVMARREWDTALHTLRELRGGQLDRDCVDALIDVLKVRPVMVGAREGSWLS